jgi:twitching motility protein PilJ
MAINLQTLTRPFLRMRAEQSSTTLIMDGMRRLQGKEPGQLPLIGHLPVEKQYRITLAATLAFFTLAASLLVWNIVQVGRKADYLGTSTGMQMLSQRLAKGAQLAVLGNEDAFRQLAEGSTKYKDDLAGLTQGNAELSASPGFAEPLLAEVDGIWKPMNQHIQAIVGQQSQLVAVNKSVADINKQSASLQELSEQIVSLLNQTGAGRQEQNQAGQMVMLTQRMAKNANALMAGETVDPENAFVLDRDMRNYGEIARGMLAGSSRLGLPAARDPDVRDKLVELEESFRAYETAAGALLKNVPDLVRAKRAALEIFKGSDPLLASTQKLTEAYAGMGGAGLPLSILFALLGAGSLVLFGMVNLNDVKRRATKSEEENRRNQEAILRLLDEMGQLAEGDLTVNATVTEDITGAIADSINFTIEELRTLVNGIHGATSQVDLATGAARSRSDELLAAAARQSQEIQETSGAVVNLSHTIQQVSSTAAESARVAGQSLAAAQAGERAVSDAITGMNAIREQIQETSKRIKRLGESSQEIGEIVELISDITEQTNVLALNAAIQAAAAGEAGRGFSVVAEEVQRLAERSGESTKQIAALVKTIQSDTLDAVSAMEVSTQGVVEGARLSDAAGQALHEIGEVSNKLAGLIQDISDTTQKQAESAAKVASNMQEIQSVTEQTTSGTRQTADSVSALSALAQELKSSVSGFKLA